jgi:hypothetical protein
MQVEKISKTVASALTYLGDSADAHAKGNKAKVVQLTWMAASDLEYGLFLFSLMYPEETSSSSWKPPSTKKPEIDSLITSAQNLLKEAAKSLESGGCIEAYKKTWMARGQLFRIHDFYEKKQRNAQRSREHITSC